MVIKIYVKIIVFCTLLWNQKDKEADEWINDWGPLCNFFGRSDVWTFPKFDLFFIDAFSKGIGLARLSRIQIFPLYQYTICKV